MTTSQTSQAPELVAVDLDGTLVLGNSFHEFLVVAWSRGGARLRWRVFRAIVYRALSRRRDSRWRMKQQVLGAFNAASPRRRQRIVDDLLVRLSSMLSEPIMREIRNARADGARVVLATAAPACYARPFAESLGFSECLATESSEEELLGPAKASAVMALLGGQHERVRLTVITDHRDDLPLMRMASAVVIQSTAEDLERIRLGLEEHTASIRHIDVSAEQDDGGLWLWFDDRPSGPHDVWELRTILSKHRYSLGYVGDGRWVRVQAGLPLGRLVPRQECPTPPSLRQRFTTLLRRRIVRDRLGIFH